MFRHQNHYSLAFWKIRIQTIFLFYVLVLNRTTWLAGWREKPPSTQFLVGQTDLTRLSTGNLLIPEGLFFRLLIYSNTSVVVFIQNILPANSYERLPYLGDTSNIPSIWWYVWLETRLIWYTRFWLETKLLLQKWTKNGFHGYSKTK